MSRLQDRGGKAVSEEVIGPDGMMEYLTNRPGRIYKHRSTGLEVGKWNRCDSGTLMVFPSAKALEGASGAWLCAVVIRRAGGGFETGIWSPMFARGGLSESGMTPASARQDFDTLDEAKEAALVGLAEASEHFEKGKWRYRRLSRWLLAGLAIAAGAWMVLDG